MPGTQHRSPLLAGLPAGRRASRVLLLGTLAAGLLLGAGCASALEKGLRRVELADDAGAEREFKRALEDPALEAQARAELARIYLRRAKRAQRAEAEALYLEALAYDRGLEEARLDLGRMYMTDRRYEEGIALLEAEKSCSGCTALEAALLYERGKARIAEGKGEMGRDDLERSMAFRKDPMVALAFVSVYVDAEYGEAMTAVEDLRRAAPLITERDQAARRAFAEARRRLAEAAAARQQADAVDAILATEVPFEDMSEDYKFAFEVSKMEFNAGDYARALDRAALILLEHYQDLSDADKISYNAALAYMYSIRAAVQLAAGNAAQAKADLEEGLFVAPGNQTMLLQKVLAEALINTSRALRMLDELAVGERFDHQIRAIVHALRVHDAIEDGQLSLARRALEAAQALEPDLPEVRVAMAALLMQTRFPGLSQAQYKAVREKGLFRYPRGRVNSYAEALAELRWAKEHLQEIGEQHPFRGPGLVARIEDLSQQITGFFPYEVKFHPEATCILVVENTGDGELELSLAVNGQREKLGLAPGTPVEIEVARPGFTELAAGSVDKVMITEPYTRMFVKLE